MPLQKQGSKCLLATNAVAFDEKAAELAEREFIKQRKKEAYAFVQAKRDTSSAAGGAPGTTGTSEDLEQQLRSQHEEAVARLLQDNNRDCQGLGPELQKQQQCWPDQGSADMEQMVEGSKRGECWQGMQEGDAGKDPEPTKSELRVSGVTHCDGDYAGAAGAAGKLADERQEAVAVSQPAATTAATAAETQATAAAATGRNGAINGEHPQADKEPWMLWKVTASADMEGGITLAPG
eukprot:1143400-Pelagomonas_calceolata.AAC.8